MKSKLIGLLTGVLTLGAAGAASAADMAVKAAPPPPPIVPPCTWCGFYIGVNAGGSWANNDATYTQFPGGATASARLDSTGFIGGGQIGYSWQWNNFVLGLEGDVAWRDQSASATLLPFAPGNVNDVVNVSNRQGWLATIRPRAGVAFNNFLLYVTGGVAFGDVSHSYQEIRLSTGQNRLFTDSDTRTGWTAGVGGEWKFAPNWSLGVEYLHVDLGSTTNANLASVSGGLAFPASQAVFENKSDIVRAKLNYYFGGPVVARY